MLLFEKVELAPETLLATFLQGCAAIEERVNLRCIKKLGPQLISLYKKIRKRSKLVN